MKNFKIIAILLLSSFITLSCSSDDKPIDNVLDNTERGAILRTTHLAGTYNFFDTNDSFFKFEIGVEAQDLENGELVKEIRLYQSFKDNTDDGVDNSKPEVLVKTVEKPNLTTSANGFPEFNTTVLLSEALALNGLSSGQFFGGDQFVYRFELELNDGRVFSTAVGGTVSGGSFFSSPFQYTVNIKCVPITPFAGTYELKLVDIYGDGWDGAFITVTVDGVSTDYTASGGGTNHTIVVPATATSLDFKYTPGSFEGEHKYKIIFSDGTNTIEAAADGPAPTPGTIFLNICL